MSAASTLRTIATHLSRAFEPLLDAVSDADAFRSLSRQLGFDIQTGAPAAYANPVQHLGAVITAVEGDDLGGMLGALEALGRRSG